MPLFVGFLSGLVLVMPVGPTTLSIVGIGTERGRRAALAGVSGVVTADLLMLPLAVLGAGALTALSPTVLHSCEVVIGLVLLGIAAVGLFKTEEARVAVSRIRRPVPTLLAINLCNPMAVASWAGLILVLPDSLREPGNLLSFAIGVVIASAAWHTMLALLAGSLSRRMAEAGRRRLIRISSVALGIVGVMLIT